MNLEQMKKRDKVRKYNDLQNGPVSEYYDDEDQIVSDYKNDVGIDTQFFMSQEGHIKARQKRIADDDPHKNYYGTARRPGMRTHV